MIRYLVSHGANLYYVDHALRNALYWSIYNCCGEIAVFLIEAGSMVKPWTWLEDEGLPRSIVEESGLHQYIRRVRHSPLALKVKMVSKELKNYIKHDFLGN